MGQEESTEGVPSDLLESAKFTSDNPSNKPISDDIYSRQNISYQIMYESYMKKVKAVENDQFYADNFYVEILKNYNQNILSSSNNVNDQIPLRQIEKDDQSRFSGSEVDKIEKLNHETEEIYNCRLPCINADINILKGIIEAKQQNKEIKRNHDSDQVFCPDCSVFDLKS